MSTDKTFDHNFCLKGDYDTRKAILKNKLFQEGIDVEDEVVSYIADNIKTNIRELEGVVISIIAYASFDKRSLDLTLASEIVSRYVAGKEKIINNTLTIEKIKQLVGDYFRVSVEEIDSKGRKREFVQARQLSMYFAKKHIKLPLKKIGELIGNRDHTTVLYSCKVVEDLISTDKEMKASVAHFNELFFS